MQLYGGWKTTLADVSNPSYVSRGKRSSRYPRIIVRRPLKKRVRQLGKLDSLSRLMEIDYQLSLLNNLTTNTKGNS